MVADSAVSGVTETIRPWRPARPPRRGWKTSRTSPSSSGGTAASATRRIALRRDDPAEKPRAGPEAEIDAMSPDSGILCEYSCPVDVNEHVTFVRRRQFRCEK